jgi:hypothetical protein
MGESIWALLHGSALSFAWPVVVLAQIACVIHVLKTGRPYWWIWIIFAVPLIGLAAYIYLEVRPSWGKLDWQSFLWKLKSSRERIHILEGNLEESTTVRNRLALAEELHKAGQFDRECEVLSEGLRGAFKDDAQLLMRLAEALLEAGRVAEAEQILGKTVPEKSADAQLQFALLQARVLGRQGRNADAERQFQELVSRKKSEGPRYYYAEFLLANGRRDEAVTILTDILHQYRRGTVVWRFLERKWFYAARKLLKSPPALTHDRSAAA